MNMFSCEDSCTISYASYIAAAESRLDILAETALMHCIRTYSESD